MSMEDEKAAEEFIKEHEYFSPPTKISFLAGASHGRKMERSRIWAKIKEVQTIAEFVELGKLAGSVRVRELHSIIFGGEGEKAD